MTTEKLALKQGDYVLATKYHDGDPGDHFCIGFYDQSLHYFGGGVRHLVKDLDGNQFRGNGFRRVEKISPERGEFLVRNFQEVVHGSRSVWWWKRVRMSAQEITKTQATKA